MALSGMLGAAFLDDAPAVTDSTVPVTSLLV